MCACLILVPCKSGVCSRTMRSHLTQPKFHLKTQSKNVRTYVYSYKDLISPAIQKFLRSDGSADFGMKDSYIT